MSTSVRMRRRQFAALGGTSLLAFVGCGGDDVAEPGGGNLGAGDLRVLDFAHGLERLEASFYERVLDRDVLRGRARRLVAGFLEDERAHIRVLERLLREGGGRPSDPPAIDVGSLVARQPRRTLLNAVALEELGAAGYLGQLDEVNDRSLLAAAMSIHSVEGRHAAALHRLLDDDPTPEGAFATPLSRPTVLRQLRELAT